MIDMSHKPKISKWYVVSGTRDPFDAIAVCSVQCCCFECYHYFAIPTVSDHLGMLLYRPSIVNGDPLLFVEPKTWRLMSPW